jgi:ribosomal-protein-alanine N-acetyltransferase
MLPSDLDAVVRLENEIFSDPWPRSAFEREVRGENPEWPRVAVDTDTGDLLAYMVAWFVADEVHLANVATSPETRRRGVAQQLLEDLVREGRRRGARMVLLEVRRSNRAAQAFYRKNRFHFFSVRRGYYRDNREDALIMVKALDETEAGGPAPGAA